MACRRFALKSRLKETCTSDQNRRKDIMIINGYTRTCGVMGNPVEHTMSPAIHNTLAEELGENLAYVPFRVPAGLLR